MAIAKTIQGAEVAKVTTLVGGHGGFTQAWTFVIRVPELGNLWFCLQDGSAECDHARTAQEQLGSPKDSGTPALGNGE